VILLVLQRELNSILLGVAGRTEILNRLIFNKDKSYTCDRVAHCNTSTCPRATALHTNILLFADWSNISEE